MNAIETEYKGYRFRSRLEARWAVFFDTLGIQWKYEDQGYEVGEHRYLPDFYLPGLDAWAEVKGDPEGLRSEFQRMRAVFGPRSPLPGFADGKTGVIVLSDIPEEPSYEATALHPYISRGSGVLDRTWGFFYPMKAGGHSFSADERSSSLYLLFGRYASGDMSEQAECAGWNVDSWTLRTRVHFDPVWAGYKAARQARFEHGANGR